MIRNIKKTFPPKTGMQKKQVLQDPGYVKDACCMLSAKYSNNTVDWCQFYILSKTLKILKQAITDYIKFILFHVRDVYNVYKLQCRF